MEETHVEVLVLGGGSAGSNAARAAAAENVVMIHEPTLLNTCVEEGCMPSKSILAGAHQNENLDTVLHTRNAHIDRLKDALLESFETESFIRHEGTASFIDNHTVSCTGTDGSVTTFVAEKIIIATGSTPFIPPIEGLDISNERIRISDDVVSKQSSISTLPKRLLTIGAGPIGLELSTFYHDLGTHVEVLQRGSLLEAYDPEFGTERKRASEDKESFIIHTESRLEKIVETNDGLLCTIINNDTIREEYFDEILIATGRRPNTDSLHLEKTDIALGERGNIEHNEMMQTSVSHIYVAGDVVGHHQILHFASEMGRVAGKNSCSESIVCESINYDKLMLAVSFDQFPSALIGLTETEAAKRGIPTICATRYFNSIGLGILKRQEYGLWKIVANKSTGKIIGSQVLGPDSSGELIQVLSPIIFNENTCEDILKMTWYHPTYAEIIKSLARDLTKQLKHHGN